MNNLTLYVDTTKAPNANPVYSLTNNNPDDSVLAFVSGDKIPVNVVFVSGGDYDTSVPVTGSASSSFYLAVGLPTGTVPYTSTNQFYISSSWGITGSLDLSTGGVTGSFGVADDYITPTMQLSIYTPSGSANRRTVMMKKITIYNAVDK